MHVLGCVRMSIRRNTSLLPHQISLSESPLCHFLSLSHSLGRAEQLKQAASVTTYSILLQENASKILRAIVILNNLKCLFCESRAGRLNGPSDAGIRSYTDSFTDVLFNTLAHAHRHTSTHSRNIINYVCPEIRLSGQTERQRQRNASPVFSLERWRDG